MNYTNSVNKITSNMLDGFFVGWPNPPGSETHLKLLENSSHVMLAIDEKTNRVAGFITAISDGVLTAYIPLLEVLPDYQDSGIGNELVNRMLKELTNLYMVDLCCDEDLVPFYERHGMFKTNG